MTNDPLEQLRDIHTPIEPGWWPPALGWWLLFIIALIVLIRTGLILWAWYKRRAPYREARRIDQLIFSRFTNGELSAGNYAHEANGLLKRLSVHIENDPVAAAESGDDWVLHLTKLAGADGLPPEVVDALSVQRFRAGGQLDVALLHHHIQQLLRKPLR